jgi:CheY-like chemotaxis protein
MNAPLIALIDDDHSWLAALAEYLQGKGFSVLTAVDPTDGLALVSQFNISVVICDYEMPGMSGLELTRSICRQLRNVAVLMVSGEEEASLAAQASAAGARGFLDKTTAPPQIVRKLRQILADLQAEELGGIVTDRQASAPRHN